MKVCMVTSSYPRNDRDGAGMYVGALARSLVAAGHTVHVVAPYDPLVEEMDQGGVSVHRFRYTPCVSLASVGHGRALEADVRMKTWVPLLMPFYGMAAIATVLKLNRGVHFDLVHGHWAVPGGVLAAVSAQAMRKPLIITLHGSDVFVTQTNALYERLARIGYDHAYRTTAVSDDLRQRAIEHGLREDRSCVISSGVDTKRFAGGSGESFRRMYGIPRGSPVVGALGRLVHKKGFMHLVDAMAHVLQDFPDAYCVIGGAGHLQSELAERIVRLGCSDRVLLPGEVSWSNAPAFYAMCDIVAVPSIVDASGNVDGLPLVLLEAMAGSRPIVASRVAGIPDVIVDGLNGLLVAPGNAVELGHALLRLLRSDSLRAALAVAARDTVVQRYDWASITTSFIGYYTQAVSEWIGPA